MEKIVAALCVFGLGICFAILGSISVKLAWILVFASGLASAPFFPTIVGITFSKFSPETYGSVFGIIFAGALLGGSTIPKIIGNLAEGSSVRRSMRLLIPACMILMVLAIALGTL